MRQRRNLGGLFWPLVLVAIGALLLARNMGYTIAVWRSLAVYWPVMIIAWGLVKVVDYYRLRDGRQPVFSAGEVVLMVAVVIVGSGLTVAANVNPDFGLVDLIGEEFDLFDILGENHEFTTELAADIEAGRIIEIHNANGAVEVEPGDAGRIEIVIEKVVRAASAADAAELEPDLVFSIEDRGGRYIVDSNRDRLRESVRRRFRTSLRVRLPATSTLEVENSYGGVQIVGLTGDQVVDNRYGAVTLNQIDGSARIADRYGPVSADAVTGGVTVANRYGAVTLNEIGGVATVENQYAPVELANITGRVVINNRYSSVQVRGAGGDVRIGGRNNRVEIEDIQGTVDVDTSYRNLDARNLMDSINVASRHGDVLLRFDTPPRGPVTVTGDYTNVRIELPSDSRFSLEAQTRSGGFDSDFEGFERDASGRNLRVTGEEGVGGPRITINTARGDIRLVERD